LNRRTRRPPGFSLIELLIVVAIILIILLVALPNIDKARKYAIEMAAAKTITSIHTAQFHYLSQYDKFAGSLAELGRPESGEASASAVDFSRRALLKPVRVTAIGISWRSRLTNGYTISACPTVFGGTGPRTFFSARR
jgi:type IV pilus assembly protein PilA